jgi:hypothetical protein
MDAARVQSEGGAMATGLVALGIQDQSQQRV